jgi:hypothetical protein
MPYAFATHPSANEVLRVPGYLFWNPSALTNETTWGTKLGFCEKGIKVEIDYRYKTFSGEINGDEPMLKVFLGCVVSVSALLKNYNSTALQVLFPGLTAGTSLSYPNTILPGTSLLKSQYTSRLMYVPEDCTNNPCFILQRAAPNIEDSLQFSRVTDTDFYASFKGFRKGDNQTSLCYLGLITGGVLV